MWWNGGYGDDDWRARWRYGERRRRPEHVEALVDLALQVGLWAAGCLAIASLTPAPLVPLVLRELLLVAAAALSLVGLWHEERLGLERFNRQDVALALLALALIAGFFADPAAVDAFAQSQGAVAPGAEVAGRS